MRESPDAIVVRSFLTRVARRLRTLAAIRGAAIGIAAAGFLLLIAAIPNLSWTAAVSIAAAAGLAGAIAGARLTRPNATALIEARVPASRNVLFTAAELLAAARKAPPYVADRVIRDAAGLTRSIQIDRVFPARVAALAGIGGIALGAMSVALALTRDAHRSSDALRPDDAHIESVEVIVTPPAYSGRATTKLDNPARLEVLAGSRIDLAVRARAQSVSAASTATLVSLASQSPQSFAGILAADADGFLTLTPQSPAGSDGLPRIIEIDVTPDAGPRVRITAPGRDLIVASAARTLDVTIEADDDIAIESLRLRYTKISGSGENFSFADGDVVIATSRSSAQKWTARASWPLGALGLEPGDTLIYRGVATDGRPGAPPAESDAFIVEITAPGSVPAEGFAVDDRMDKYAISQQMVILRTERLLAARGSMSAENFKSDALDIAAEQRQVRAEFVFMMGGELADAGIDLNVLNEEEEAAGEADLAAGRLVNQGRAELLRAIRSMSRAAALLTEPNAVAALPVEKEALTHLQKAFSRSRYILRTLGARERLDLTRRLTGVLAALARDGRPAAESKPDPQAIAIQDAMRDLASLAADPDRASPRGSARAGSLAAQIRVIDPASVHLRDAASAIATLANSLSGRQSASAIQAAIDRATVSLVAAARQHLQAAASTSTSAELASLAGRLNDALRKERR